MLLAASNSLLNLGVRPRAVTTPVQIRSHSGTWGRKSTVSKDLCPNTRPPVPTPKATYSSVQKAYHFSTIHIPRLRESRRSNLASVVAAAPPFMPPADGIHTGRQARKGASDSESLDPALRVIKGQEQQPLALALATSELSPGTKPDQSSDDQRVTPVPTLSLVPTVEHQSLIAEQAPPSASADSARASNSASASDSTSANSAGGASASASASDSASANSGASASANSSASASSGASASASASASSGASVSVSVSVSASATGASSGATSVNASGASTRHIGVPVPPLRPARPESPLAHARRSAGPNHVPPARLETVTIASGTSTDLECYRLSIALPRPGGVVLAAEMITVSARRGGRLAVVADAWHLEHDCHYEWHVAFPQPDIDLGAVRARIDEEGVLVIDVPRRRRWHAMHTACRT